MSQDEGCNTPYLVCPNGHKVYKIFPDTPTWCLICLATTGEKVAARPKEDEDE